MATHTSAPLSAGVQTIQPVPIPAPAQSNSAAAVQAFIDASTEWGQKEGSGAISRYGWLLHMGGCAYRKEIDKADIATGWDAYQAARKAAKTRGKQNDGKDRGSRIAEATANIFFVATLPTLDGYKALMSIDEVIKKNPELPGEIAALLIKGCKVQKSSPNAVVPKDVMLQGLQPTEQDPKTVADKLAAVAKTLNKIGEDHEWTGHRRSAYTSVLADIEAEGGTTKGKLEKAKAAAKAARLAKKVKRK